jgi:hypothetical protein
MFIMFKFNNNKKTAEITLCHWKMAFIFYFRPFKNIFFKLFLLFSTVNFLEVYAKKRKRPKNVFRTFKLVAKRSLVFFRVGYTVHMYIPRRLSDSLTVCIERARNIGR